MYCSIAIETAGVIQNQIRNYLLWIEAKGVLLTEVDGFCTGSKSSTIKSESTGLNIIEDVTVLPVRRGQSRLSVKSVK